jgi:hypothetical protein
LAKTRSKKIVLNKLIKDFPREFEPVIAKFLFTILLNAKPNMSAEVTRRMEDYEKSLGKLC